eukprot:TRINITY_DN12264_c0_g1_i13.p2 TRINITY_DN12264_c0_g1~~TRINITY_DN12264_c0_g1_i13.p2  ORF type:complete len:108 (+),score=8.93 TRINITY_DN12264_c0_g1_i13:1077-1400(+)
MCCQDKFVSKLHCTCWRLQQDSTHANFQGLFTTALHIDLSLLMHPVLWSLDTRASKQDANQPEADKIAVCYPTASVFPPCRDKVADAKHDGADNWGSWPQHFLLADA